MDRALGNAAGNLGGVFACDADVDLAAHAELGGVVDARLEGEAGIGLDRTRVAALQVRAIAEGLLARAEGVAGGMEVPGLVLRLADDAARRFVELVAGDGAAGADASLRA